VKVAEVVPEDTVTEEGTRNAPLLLRSATIVGLVAAALKETEQDLVCVPVRDWVPQESPANLAAGVDATGARVTTSVCLTPPAVAVRVAFCVVLTADAVAVKTAEVLPAATTTDAGTRRAALLLASIAVV